MTIVIYTGNLLEPHPDAYGRFLEEMIFRMVKNNPGHRFVLATSLPLSDRLTALQNIAAQVMPQPGNNILSQRWWHDVRLPRLLNKQKAAIFLSFDGLGSLNTKIPQCIVVQNYSFLHPSSFTRQSRYLFYKKFQARHLKKAAKVITHTTAAAEELYNACSLAPGKINTIHIGPGAIFRPLPAEEQRHIKEKYTGGTEYFICTCPVDSRTALVNLLKGFSNFKKRQQSSWKLVLAGKISSLSGSFLKSLETYKHRADVIVTGNLEEKELAALTAAAYAAVQPLLWDDTGLLPAEAMQCDVPVIVSPLAAQKELAGDAVLYADPQSPADIADKMMLLYKDERLRAKLIGSGRALSEAARPADPAEKLWQTIMSTSA